MNLSEEEKEEFDFLFDLLEKSKQGIIDAKIEYQECLNSPHYNDSIICCAHTPEEEEIKSRIFIAREYEKDCYQWQRDLYKEITLKLKGIFNR